MFRTTTLLLFASFLLNAFPEQANGQTALRGRVTELNTNSKHQIPIAGASIRLFPDNSNAGRVAEKPVPLATTTTDGNGFYSISGLPLEKVIFEISAEGYESQKDGRAIQLTRSIRNETTNFVLKKPADKIRPSARLRVKLFHRFNAVDKEVSGVVIAREVTTGQMVQGLSPYSQQESEQDLMLVPGTWNVSASWNGNVSQYPNPIGIKSGDLKEIELRFQHVAVTPGSLASAIVSVQHFDSENLAAAEQTLPEVTFFSKDRSTRIDATVTAVDQSELAQITDSGNVDGLKWYWAEGKGFTPGDFFAEARLAGMPTATSGTESLSYSDLTIFHLSLQSRSELGKLSGRLTKDIEALPEDSEEEPSPETEPQSEGDATPPQKALAGWDIVAIHSEKKTTRKTTSNLDGDYELLLSPGLWWVQAVEPVSARELVSSPPVPILASKGSDATHDIHLSQSIESIVPSGHYAIVGVERLPAKDGNSEDPTSIPPTVTFVADSTPRQPASVPSATKPTNQSVPEDDVKSLLRIDGSTKLLTSAQLEELGIPATMSGGQAWFLTEPVQPLGLGTYHVAATLEKYHDQRSSSKETSDGQVFFHLQMAPQKSSGSLLGKVVDATTNQPIPNSKIHLALTKTAEEITQEKDGNFSLPEISEGRWMITATADGYSPSIAKLIDVTAGKPTTFHLELMPQKPLTTDAFAIVGVENLGSALPVVTFHSPEHEQGTEANLSPLSAENATRLASDYRDGWTYFLATPPEPLDATRILVRGTSGGSHPVQSEFQQVQYGSSTIFQLQLKEEPAPLAANTGSLHGRVEGVNAEGEYLGLVANATIELMQFETGVILATTVSDANGYYQFNHLPSAKIKFRLHAKNYTSENSDRGFELKSTEEPQVLDFMMTKQDPTDTRTQLAIGVWQEGPSGESTRVENATVVIEHGEGFNNRQVVSLKPHQDYRFEAKPEILSVSASAPGFVDSVAHQITLRKGDQTTLKIILQPMVSDARVLVSVARDTDDKSATQPSVALVPNGNHAASVSTKLSPVDKADIAALTLDTGRPIDWFWAQTENAILPGDYHAEGKLANYPLASSSTQTVSSGETTIFHLSLTPPDQTFYVAGTATESGEKQLLPNSQVQFESIENQERKSVSTDSNGRYSVVLSPGDWWASATPPAEKAQLTSATPKRISVPKSANLTHNFVFTRSTETKPLKPELVAIVAVPLASTDSPSPTVSFTAQNGLIYSQPAMQIQAADLERLGVHEMTGYQWYTAKITLPPGLVSASANLAGFETVKTAAQAVTPGRTTRYLLTLHLEQKSDSSLLVRIVDARSKSLLKTASVQLIRRYERQDIHVFGGIAGPEKVPPGEAWLIAQAEGFHNSAPQAVQLISGKQTVAKVALKPMEKQSPAATAFALLDVYDNGPMCSSPPAPAVQFVSLDHSAKVPGNIKKLSESDEKQVFQATPSTPLGGGNWKVVATIGEKEQQSQPKQLSEQTPNVFSLVFEFPRTVARGSIGVWAQSTSPAKIKQYRQIKLAKDTFYETRQWSEDNNKAYQGLEQQLAALRSNDMLDAAVQLVSQDPLASPISLKSFEDQAINPGWYWVTAAAPGYQTNQPIRLVVGCDGQIQLDIPLAPESDTTKTTLQALVRVDSIVDDTAPVSPRPVYSLLLSPRQSLLGLLTYPAADNVPKVSFHQESRAPGDSHEPIDAIVNPLDSDAAKRLGIENTSGTKWYWARSKTSVTEGTFFATASLAEYSGDETAPQIVTAASSPTFELNLSNRPSTGPSKLFVNVLTEPGEEMVTDASVSIRSIESGRVEQSVTTYGQPAEFDVLPGRWEVSVQKEGFKPYQHTRRIQVRAGHSETCTARLQERAQEKAPFGALDVLVAVRHSQTPISGSPTIVAQFENTFEVTEQVPESIEKINSEGEVYTVSTMRERKKHAKLTAELPIENIATVSPTHLKGMGIPLANYPANEWTWFLGKATADELQSVLGNLGQGQPLIGSTVSARIELLGYSVDRVPTGSVLLDSKTVLDATMQPVRPQLNFLAEDRRTQQPISNVRVSVWSSELGQSFSDAMTVQTDQEGKATLELPQSGEYKILANASEFEPYSDVVMFNASNVDKTIPLSSKTMGATFLSGKVVEEGNRDRSITGATISLTPLENDANNAMPNVVTNDQGEFRQNEVPTGRYKVKVTAEGFTSSMLSIEVIPGVPPLEVALTKRNAAFENALHMLLTKGWDDPKAAQTYFQAAKQANPKGPLVDYAMGIVLAHQAQLQASLQHFGSSLRNRDGSFVWDRAAEGRLWGNVKTDNTTQAVKDMVGLAGLYGNRTPTHASLDTAKRMGNIVGLLMGGPPADLRKQISGKLSKEHLVAFNRGLDQTMNANSETDSEPDAQAWQRRATEIDSELKRLQTALASILQTEKSAIQNQRVEFNPKQEELDRLTEERKQQTARLESLRRDGQSKSKQAIDLSHEIIEKGVRITQLEKAKTVLETQIRTLTKTNDPQKQNLQTRIQDLEKEKNNLTDKMKEEGTTEPPGSSSKSLLPFPLDQHRQELLDFISYSGNTPETTPHPQPLSMDPPVVPKNPAPKPVLSAAPTPKPPTPDNSQLAEEKFRLGRQKFDQGDNAGANKLFAETNALNPNHFGAWALRGHLAYNAGKKLAAITYLSKAIEIRPEDPDPYFDRGNCWLQSEAFEKAIADFSISLRIVGNSNRDFRAEALSKRAESYYRSGQVDRCMEDADQAIHSNADFGPGYRMLALGLMHRKQYPDAIEVLSTAIRIDSSDIIAIQNRSKCFVALTPTQNQVQADPTKLRLYKTTLQRALNDIDTCARINPHERAIQAEQAAIRQALLWEPRRELQREPRKELPRKPEAVQGY